MFSIFSAFFKAEEIRRIHEHQRKKKQRKEYRIKQIKG